MIDNFFKRYGFEPSNLIALVIEVLIISMIVLIFISATDCHIKAISDESVQDCDDMVSNMLVIVVALSFAMFVLILRFLYRYGSKQDDLR